MNWEALLAELRMELEDTSDNPKWPDQALYMYTREAVFDYSRHLPRRMEGVVLTVDETDPTKFALPDDFIAEVSVQCPLLTFLEPSRGRLGLRVFPSRTALYYRIDKPSLFLNADPAGEDVTLSYDALHAVPEDKDDLTFEFTVPLADMELIKLYVEGKINSRIRNAQARLDRFKIGAGARTDNPMTHEVTDFFATYHAKLAERLQKTSVMLFRPRKRK